MCRCAHVPIGADRVAPGSCVWVAGNEYSHNTIGEINAMSVAAYLAAGHGVIDVENMLGMRRDAHLDWGGGVHSSDALHYCEPGPVDYALDFTLRALGYA